MKDSKATNRGSSFKRGGCWGCSFYLIWRSRCPARRTGPCRACPSAWSALLKEGTGNQNRLWDSSSGRELRQRPPSQCGAAARRADTGAFLLCVAPPPASSLRPRAASAVWLGEGGGEHTAIGYFYCSPIDTWPEALLDISENVRIQHLELKPQPRNVSLLRFRHELRATSAQASR